MLISGQEAWKRARKLTAQTIDLEGQIEMKWENNISCVLVWMKGCDADLTNTHGYHRLKIGKQENAIK